MDYYSGSDLEKMSLEREDPPEREEGYSIRTCRSLSSVNIEQMKMLRIILMTHGKCIESTVHSLY